MVCIWIWLRLFGFCCLTVIGGVWSNVLFDAARQQTGWSLLRIMLLFRLTLGIWMRMVFTMANSLLLPYVASFVHRSVYLISSLVSTLIAFQCVIISPIFTLSSVKVMYFSTKRTVLWIEVIVLRALALYIEWCIKWIILFVFSLYLYIYRGRDWELVCVLGASMGSCFRLFNAAICDLFLLFYRDILPWKLNAIFTVQNAVLLVCYCDYNNG